MAARFLSALAALWLCASAPRVATADSLELDLPSGEVLSVTRYPNAEGPSVLLLPSVYAVPRLEEVWYTALSRDAGLDLWVGDFLGAHFLSELSINWNKVPSADIAAALSHIREAGEGRALMVMASGRGLMAALRGAQHWLDHDPEDRALAGAVGLSGDLYHQRPQPGQWAELDPLLADLHFPLLLFQPQHAAHYWWLDRTREALASGRQAHHVQVLPGVRDGFYHREDRHPKEIELSRAFPLELRGHIDSLLAKRQPR